MEISVVGTGYVGLVTGTCLAANGHRVTCSDIDREVVARINDGQSPIFEANLDELLLNAVNTGNLRATTDIVDAVANSDVAMICVGTPPGVGGVDLQYIIKAAENIGKALETKSTYTVVAVKSTVLPGTTEEIVQTTIQEHSGRPLGDGWGLCMNPEFLREGQAVKDCLTPDRIIIGASDRKAGRVFSKVYEWADCPTLITSLRTAEMIKYVANSLFATAISFSNEIANVCSSIPGVNAQEVWKGVHLDRRLTPTGDEGRRAAGFVEFLWHGLGFGGSCFPKDVAAFQKFGKDVGAVTPLLDAVLATNNRQPLRLVSLMAEEMDLKNRTVAVLGLAFKPGTDDLRESSALPVIKALLDLEARVVAHDPVALSRARSHPDLQGVTLVDDWSSALKDADACCLVTAWPEYKSITPEDFKRLMRRPVVIDGRGLYDPQELGRAGVRWRGIGYTPKQKAVRPSAVRAALRRVVGVAVWACGTILGAPFWDFVSEFS